MRSEHEPKFLITGSGRCGTQYLAEVLRKCYVNAGHESWWTLNPEGQVPDLVVDISWMGCFDTGFEGKVFTVVRDPFDCIPSIYAQEGLHPWSMMRTQNVRITPDTYESACRIWLAYTDVAMRRSNGVFVRVEELSTSRYMKGMVEVLGGYPDVLQDALAETPTNINTRSLSEDFQWIDSPITSDVVEYGKSLGYDTQKILESIQK